MKLRLAILVVLILCAGVAEAQQPSLRAVAPQACPVSVCLAWDASPSAPSTPNLTYNVYRASVAGGCANVAAAGCVKVNSPAITALSFNDSTLAAGRRFYTVRAEADGLLSGPSNELAVSLPPLPPAVLRALP